MGFFVKEDSPVMVDTMRNTEEYAVANMGGFRMLEIPYKGERIVMQILLPDPGIGLLELEQKISLSSLEKSFENKKGFEKTKLELPKFKIESEIPLNEALANLGMTDMFGMGADLTGIDASGNLYVSEVKQKAFIEVNEEGAEAAAATGAVMYKLKMPPPPPLEFKVNKPFIFLIRDKLTK